MSEAAKEKLVKVGEELETVKEKIKNIEMSIKTQERNKSLIRLGLTVLKGLLAIFAGAGAEKYLNVIEVVTGVI